MSLQEWSPVRYFGTKGTAPVILVCEHASFDFPDDFGSLGIGDDTRQSHAAGDIGAASVAKALSGLMAAPLVFGGVSRLIYDCNRPLSADDAIPAQSEVHIIPGNYDITDAERSARHSLIHDPFHIAVDRMVSVQTARCALPVTIVTIHSFTPVYNGQERDLDIGFLCDRNTTFSQLALDVETRRNRYRAALNKPYDVMDGVTYSLAKHADERGLHSTMIEIRNDLIDSDDKAADMSAHLSVTLKTALEQLHASLEAGQ